MRQATLATSGFEVKRKTTRKAEFLLRMDKLVPWVLMRVPNYQYYAIKTTQQVSLYCVAQ